ncbi:MMPL family transporter [Streptomyces sp. RKND-216]|uniref:MMPL family transporter n=1 Tax=Streptomyces sp. RKND-216 TaxID=2562581 RepID=UPI00109DCAC5|nr:MMPL family transporter [Streptomyces sp. RKND-216]THA26966.1 MMPL family transporter [Streptomyces sp. RKND-216]
MSTGRPAARRRPPAPPRKGRLRRLGEWCARHCVVVLLGWLAAVGGLHAAQSAFGGSYADDFTLSDSQSQQGLDVLRAHQPDRGGQSSLVVLHDGQQLSRHQQQVATVVKNLGGLPHVLSAQNPLTAPEPQADGTPSAPLSPVSPNGRTAYVTVTFDENPASLGDGYLDGVDDAVEPLRQAGVQVEYGGSLGELARPEVADLASESIGYGVAVVVLLIGFGSVLAAAVPLVAALAAVLVGLSVLGLIAATTTFAQVSPTLATMIGLGVGIDYALFLLTRHRQDLMDGADPVAAAGRATHTSGRAVLVSGTTVIVALAGLNASGVGFIGKLGAAAAVTVVTAVLGALTLVPALLGLAGRSLDRFHVRTPVAEAGADASSGFWHRYALRVGRRPWRYLAAGLVVLAVLTVPLFSLRLGHIDDGADPTSYTDRRAYDLVTDAFGAGVNGPLTVVVDQSGVVGGNRSGLENKVSSALKGLPGAAAVSTLQPTQDGDVLTATVIPAERPQSAGTTDLVHRLTDTVLPQAVAGTDAQGYVTGTTAGQTDFRDIVAERLPLIIAVVVGLALLIILTVFRGVLVAVKAAVLNLVSIGASYGVVVAVFQWGWGGPALGVSGTVPVESYVPMMMFAIVFGLSMDYEIFLLSRVHEAWLRTGDSRASVAHALEITARVITCAALIMVSVFAAFVLSSNIVVKMLGLGLAVSVLVDATLVRLLLVPAVLNLLGSRVWWAPRWLDRVLPHVHAEPQPAPDDGATDDGGAPGGDDGPAVRKSGPGGRTGSDPPVA